MALDLLELAVVPDLFEMAVVPDSFELAVALDLFELNSKKKQPIDYLLWHYFD